MDYQLSSQITNGELEISLLTGAGETPSAVSPVFLDGLVIDFPFFVAVPQSDMFEWDARKIQGCDAQLFVYLVNNNGSPLLGASPCPTLCMVSNLTGYNAMIVSGVPSLLNTCWVLGRLNVHQRDDNAWQSPIIANYQHEPIFETDWLDWKPIHEGFSTPPSGTYRYHIDRHTLHYLYKDLNVGQSNSPIYRATLPVIPAGNTEWQSIPGYMINNGNPMTQPGLVSIYSNIGYASFYKTLAAGGWATTGTKGLAGGVEGFYEI